MRHYLLRALCATPTAVLGLSAAGVSVGLSLRDTSNMGVVDIAAVVVVIAAAPALCAIARRYPRRSVGKYVFFALAALCVSYQVFAAMGKTAHLHGNEAAAAGKVSGDIAETKSKIAKAEAAVKAAKAVEASKCVGAPTELPRKGWGGCREARSQLASERDALADLRKLDAGTKPTTTAADAKAAQFAGLVGLFGGDTTFAGELARYVEPVFLPLLLELLAFAFFERALSRFHVEAAVEVEPEPKPAKPMPEPVDVRPQLRVITNKTLPRPMTNEEAAAFWKVSEGTASKWARQGVANGTLRRERIGRTVRISPA